jgi:3-hydroxybutyryl-CoA dehydrogenase
VEERLAIAGSGAIACGLAATASQHGEVLLLARSGASADRARKTVGNVCGKLGEVAVADRIRVVTDAAELRPATFLVEAVVEDHDSKVGVLQTLREVGADDAVLATTTSSLSVTRLADALGIGQRFVGLHVFNPVPKMKLVELAFPAGAAPEVRERARALCAALDKTAVEVPDSAGFVVNRLLFPYLFSAVAFLQESGMEPGDVDACMTLGAGHPMGPLALLDYVGLDVAVAIGESIDAHIPPRLRELIADGALGRKTGRGLYDYAD